MFLLSRYPDRAVAESERGFKNVSLEVVPPFGAKICGRHWLIRGWLQKEIG